MYPKLLVKGDVTRVAASASAEAHLRHRGFAVLTEGATQEEPSLALVLPPSDLAAEVVPLHVATDHTEVDDEGDEPEDDDAA